jgi:hypothetical protein
MGNHLENEDHFIHYDGAKFPIKAWLKGFIDQTINDPNEIAQARLDAIEPQALAQLRNIADMPFIHKHVAVMPDVHMGKGATIGSVIATKNVIIPSAVGVDIGCGMSAVRTSLTASDMPDSLGHIRAEIERAVPMVVPTTVVIMIAVLGSVNTPDDAKKRFVELVTDWYAYSIIMNHIDLSLDQYVVPDDMLSETISPTIH